MFQALPQSNGQRANAQNVSFQTLYGGQFTLSTQLIILIYPVIQSQSVTCHKSETTIRPQELTSPTDVRSEQNKKYNVHNSVVLSPNRFFGSMKIIDTFCNFFINCAACTIHSKGTPDKNTNTAYYLFCSKIKINYHYY